MNYPSGPFHSGTIFVREIELDQETEEELQEKMKEGYVPVFWVGLGNEE